MHNCVVMNGEERGQRGGRIEVEEERGEKGIGDEE
jgi:hypothetical protein